MDFAITSLSAPTIFSFIYLLFRCNCECSSHYSRKDCECC